MLEKEKETWWDQLLTSEDPIDLKKINAERDFGSLPEDERRCIERVIADRRREERGEPSSNQQVPHGWVAQGLGTRKQPASLLPVPSSKKPKQKGEEGI